MYVWKINYLWNTWKRNQFQTYNSLFFNKKVFKLFLTWLIELKFNFKVNIKIIYMNHTNVHFKYIDYIRNI